MAGPQLVPTPAAKTTTTTINWRYALTITSRRRARESIPLHARRYERRQQPKPEIYETGHDYDYHEIEGNWQDAGITPDRQVAFYCGTGWRASETFFYAHLMGWERVAVYDGGWHEWSQDESNPIEVGEP